jgi:hypothetical protein
LKAAALQRRLKNCIARSCFLAAAREAKVPRFLLLPVFRFLLPEYSLYFPELNLRIIYYFLNNDNFIYNFYAFVDIFTQKQQRQVCGWHKN